MKLNLTLLPNDDETKIGSSHILGCPDVPSSWNDEAIFYNDEVFLGQINLKDVKNASLPDEGILYFFFACKSKPYRGIVRYASDLTNLERVDFNYSELLNVNFEQEYQITFSDEPGNIELLGTMPKFKQYRVKNDDVVLLKFNSKDYPLIDIFQDMDEEICYLIKKADLLARRFDKAFLSLNLE